MYKAWHKIEKRFFEILLIHYEKEAGGIFAYTLTDGCQDIHAFSEEIILIPSIGVYDKNTKIIFLNSIVTNGYSNFLVIWDKKCLRYALKRLDDGTICGVCSEYLETECEIIGNAQENPDLLGDLYRKEEKHG